MNTRIEDRQIVKAEVGGGRTIQLEARTAGSPEADVGIGKVRSFQDVVADIESIADGFTEALKRVKPQKAALEFGVDIGVESGALTALIVKGTGTATLKVTLEWEAASATSDG
jgi:hypothetical protein